MDFQSLVLKVKIMVNSKKQDPEMGIFNCNTNYTLCRVLGHRSQCSKKEDSVGFN